ncbi:hypothetical protein POM88_032856 [Heracleum sosnowskyi]|uniref:Ricin B lectin domain-containing protein n=1 Tax=Heracleum sosnowskyi TaxID=360622 RepID=A0AAD8I2F0_9APIA|nr:hypothetical protein POM88_032856 [Heracleum sosnowskyi]
MITFEENWDELSTRIQESVGGAIYPPFVLSDAFSNQDVTITSITPTLGRNIAVVRYVCDSCTNIPEPAVHIIGRNGLCAELQDGIYDNGNPVIMWPCTGNTLWTLMKDATIRSEGKCLTAYRLEMEEYVMIHNCTTKPKYSGWSLSNSTDPVVTPIFSYKGTCLQASANNSVQVSSCSDKSVQQWALYPDATVRPSMSTTNCLKPKSSPGGKVVVHDLCDGGNAERWLFNHDRNVSDVTNKYVLEVEENNRCKTLCRYTYH